MSRPGAFLLISIATAQIAASTPLVLLASDPGALNRAAATNSLAAHSAFLTQVGVGNLVTFEGLTPGFPNSGLTTADPNYGLLNIDVQTGIVMSIKFNAGVDTAVSGIKVTDSNPEYGFNLTGGPGLTSRFLRFGSYFGDAMGVAEVTFGFNTPTNYFSAFITGTQAHLPGTFELFFNDGNSQIVPFASANGSQNYLPKLPGMGGGVQFLALRTDSPINLLTFRTSGSGPGARDLIGLDDIQYGFAYPALDDNDQGDLPENRDHVITNEVPEPSSILLVSAGAALVLISRSKRCR